MTKQTAVGSRVFNLRLFAEALKRLRVIGIAVAILALSVSILIPTVTWISAQSQYERIQEEYDYIAADLRNNPNSYYTEADLLDLEKQLEITPAPVEPHLLCLPLYLLPFIAPFFFFLLFSFLQKRKQSDFYHAIPYTRTCVYLSFVTAALAFVATISGVSALLSGIIYAACPFTTFALPDLLGTLGLSLLSAAFLSSFMMLALSLAGTPTTTLLLFGLFALITRVVLALFSLAVDNLMIVSSYYYPYLSIYWYLPLRMFVQSERYSDVSIPTYDQLVPYTVIVTLLLFVAAGVLYKLRRSEMAERSAPTRTLQSVFRCLFTLPFALIIVTLFIVDEDNFETVLVLLVVTLLVFFLYELITTKRPKNMLKAIPWLGAVAGGVVVFTVSYLIFYASVLTAIPAHKISSVSVELEASTSYESIVTADTVTSDPRMIALVANALEDTLAIEKHGLGAYYNRYDNVRYYTHTVTIHRTNGTTAKRYLYFTSQMQTELMELLTESKEFTDLYLSLPKAEDISFANVYTNGTSYAYLGASGRSIDFYQTLVREYEALSDDEKMAFKQNGGIGEFYGDDYYQEWVTSESVVTEKFEEPYSADNSFAFCLYIRGTYRGQSFHSTYVILPSMKETISELLDYTLMEQYAEFYAYNETSGTSISFATYNGDTPKEIAQAFFTSLTEETVSLGETCKGQIVLVTYGSSEVVLNPAYDKVDYTPLFEKLSEALEKTESKDGTKLCLLSVYLYEWSGSFSADVTLGLYLTPEEYEEIIELAKLTVSE